MNYVVIIATVNRPDDLHQTVLSILRQTVQPARTFIVAPDRIHVLPETLNLQRVEYIEALAGLPVQRNRGLDRVPRDTDLVAFFDDDVELQAGYMDEMLHLFTAFPYLRIASGTLLLDGGRGAAVHRSDAQRLCEADYRASNTAARRFSRVRSAYGCNMVVRFSQVSNIRFDEKLPLYAWLEDSDYSHQCTREGFGPVTAHNAIAVHLGSRGGRMGGRNFGFSQVVNPLYLWKKSRVFPLWFIIVNYWFRCLIGNVLGCLMRDRERDRVALLKGNLIGFRHILTGHCNPQHILTWSRHVVT